MASTKSTVSTNDEDSSISDTESLNDKSNTITGKRKNKTTTSPNDGDSSISDTESLNEKSNTTIEKTTTINKVITIPIVAFGTIFLADVLTGSHGRKKIKKFFILESKTKKNSINNDDSIKVITDNNKVDNPQINDPSIVTGLNPSPTNPNPSPTNPNPSPTNPNPSTVKFNGQDKKIFYQLNNEQVFNKFMGLFTGDEQELIHLMVQLQENLSDITIVLDLLRKDSSTTLVKQLEDEFKKSVGLILTKNTDTNLKNELGFYYFESLNPFNNVFHIPAVDVVFEANLIHRTYGKFIEEMAIINFEKVSSPENIKKTNTLIKDAMDKIKTFKNKEFQTFLTANSKVNTELANFKKKQNSWTKTIETFSLNCLNDQRIADMQLNFINAELKKLDGLSGKPLIDAKIRIKSNCETLLNNWDRLLFELIFKNKTIVDDGYEVTLDHRMSTAPLDINTIGYGLSGDGAIYKEIIEDLSKKKADIMKIKYDIDKIPLDNGTIIGFDDKNIFKGFYKKNFAGLDWQVVGNTTQLMESIGNLKEILTDLFVIHMHHKDQNNLEDITVNDLITKKIKEMESLLTIKMDGNNDKLVAINFDTISKDNILKDYNIIIKTNGINKGKPNGSATYDFFTNDIIIDVIGKYGTDEFTVSSNFLANPWNNLKATVDICGKIPLKKNQEAVKAMVEEITKASPTVIANFKEKQSKDRITLADQWNKIIANKDLLKKIEAKKVQDEQASNNDYMLDWINFFGVLGGNIDDAGMIDAVLKKFNLTQGDIKILNPVI
jgi:hypothetical protein